jgi:small subunit ribosomal protein S8
MQQSGELLRSKEITNPWLFCQEILLLCDSKIAACLPDAPEGTSEGLAFRVSSLENWPWKEKFLGLKKRAGNMYTDPIADYLTRIRNAQAVGHKIVGIPASNLKKEITKVLFEHGYIRKYKFLEEGPQGTIKIALKYDRQSKKPAISKLIRVSKPGLRQYARVKSMPRVLNGLGIAIISTPKGVMTAKEAKTLKAGGEVLCYVY